MKRPAEGREGKLRAGKRATLRTIAELTGFSQSTVSLSLRGGTALREETRRRVAEAAAEVGYVPDRAGVRLRTGKTNVLSLILDRADESIDFSRRLLQGIAQAIHGTRYHLNVTAEFERDFSLDSVQYILRNRTADGVILTHTSPRDPRVQLLMDADFPFVTHGRTEFFSPHAYHDFHAEGFAQMAVERLHAKGCRRVLLVVGGNTTTNYHNIESAFGRTAARLGIEGRVEGLSAERSTRAAVRDFGLALARSGALPDGIICDSELRAICLIAGLAQGGVEVGRDVAFVCKQTSDLLPTVYPLIDTIEEDVFANGQALARLLMRRIDGEPAETLRTLGEPMPHWRD
jgi:LacI family transcriptional regulator